MSEIDAYFSSSWLSYYQKTARNYFFYTDIDYEDACQEAQLALHQKLSNIKNKGLTEAFVRACYKNILTDLFRQYFGRNRPPTWIKRLGPIWLEIWYMYCLRGMPVDALSISIIDHAKNISADWVIKVVQKIRAEQACPKPRNTEVSLDSNKKQGLIVADFSDPETEINAADVSIVVTAIIGGATEHTDTDLEALATGLFNKWENLAEQVKLSNRDKILLRLVFQEDLSISDAARELNLKIHTARRALKNCCRQIRRVLERNDILLSDFVN